MLSKSFLCFGLMTLSAALAAPQAPADDLDRIRELVAAGAAPRAALDRAQAAIEDRRDEAILRRTLYGEITLENIDEQQTSEMIEAAERRLARRQQRAAELRHMAAEGLLARSALEDAEQELLEHETTLSLARSRAALLAGISAMARLEIETARIEETQPELLPVRERFDGTGSFTRDHLRKVVLAFEKEFGKALPVSAHGDTPFHRAMGFDHSGRVDVALTPDQPEGVWLRSFLESEKIPYYAFRSFVPGAATGAHIHIGPPSLRLRVAD
jgi:multidrug efflux pump subunit AcrA (membrane-fusion protein)